MNKAKNSHLYDVDVNGHNYKVACINELSQHDRNTILDNLLPRHEQTCKFLEGTSPPQKLKKSWLSTFFRYVFKREKPKRMIDVVIRPVEATYREAACFEVQVDNKTFRVNHITQIPEPYRQAALRAIWSGHLWFKSFLG